MGKRGKRGGRRGATGGRVPRRDDQRREILKENALFEEYYDCIDLYQPEEKEVFWTVLRRELPNSFRFTGSKSHARVVQQRLSDHYVPEITSITYDGQPVEPPTQLSWFPDRLAWQMTTPKNVIRRFPPFASFQKFLVSETAVGNVSRQEVVSMIPPLLMDVRPGMTVLDLCAAPGSKAAQLIEMVHVGEESRIRKLRQQILKAEGREMSPVGDELQLEMREEGVHEDWSDDGRPTGLLIANDMDNRRAHMLVHQMKRLNSPNLIITNHDATMFPSIKLKAPPVSDGKPPRGRYLKFDRILADVPCSGDGTVRKNISIWTTWNPMNALGLHISQVRILVRALQMLKVGGRVVYSTCSMHPVENEAVVAAAIQRCGGMDKVDVLDCSNMLPGLKRRAGLKKWKVLAKDGSYWSSWDEFLSHTASEGDKKKILPSMFPPQEPEVIPLERCMRLCAHYQDTGAFFIAVLEKKEEIRAKPEDVLKATNGNAEGVVSASTTAAELQSSTEASNSTHHHRTAGAINTPAAGDVVADESIPVVRATSDTDLHTGSDNERKRKLSANTEPERNKRLALDVTDDGIENGDQQSEARHYPPPDAGLGMTARPQESTIMAKTPTSKNKQSFEEPFKYLEPNHDALQAVYSFYGINGRFPRDRFLVRNGAGIPSKKIYFTSALAKEILIENEGRGIKFIHAGVVMLVKQDAQLLDICNWRIQLDSMSLVDAFANEARVVRLYSKATLRKLLIDMFPKVSGVASREFGEIGERLRDISMGCCILRVEKGEGDDAFSERMVFPLWKSMHSVNLMLPKEERKAILLRIYNEDTPLTDSSKDRFRDSVPSPSSDSSESTPGDLVEVSKFSAEIENTNNRSGDPDEKEGVDTAMHEAETKGSLSS